MVRGWRFWCLCRVLHLMYRWFEGVFRMVEACDLEAGKFNICRGLLADLACKLFRDLG